MEKKIGLNYARLLIDVEVNAALPEKIWFRNENGNLIEQKLLYDWKPPLRKFYSKYGHAEDDLLRPKTT